ncbi:MAG TPA: hypothetical protein ENN25_07435 [Euryarchaeota archaeon]|nr:hypothetical protein [Euryarchaeota archaeon]
MSYKLPSDEEVADAVRMAISRRGVVNSQRRLAELVLKELKSTDPDFSVTEERVRRIAIDRGIVKVNIIARDSEKKTASNECPVCGVKMKRIRNLTVYGGSINLGYRCSRCGYWTGLTNRRPIRYIFSKK